MLGALLGVVLAGLVFHAIDTQQDGDDVNAALLRLEADSGSLIEAQDRALDLYDAVDLWEEGGPHESVRSSLVALDDLLASTNAAGSRVSDLVGPAFVTDLDRLRATIGDPSSNPALAYEPAETFERTAVELSRRYEDLLDPANRVEILGATEHDERGVTLVLLVVGLGLALDVVTVLRSRSIYRSSRERLERDREELNRAAILEFGEAEILAGIVEGGDVSSLIIRVLELATRLTGRRFRFVRATTGTTIDLPEMVTGPEPTDPSAPSSTDGVVPASTSWAVRAGAGAQIGTIELVDTARHAALDDRGVAVARRCADLTALLIDRTLAEQQLVHRATHDALTGMPNRSRLLEVVAAELETRRCSPDHEVALIFCDLDRFKLVNDTLGHRTGDELLQAVGQRLCTTVEGSGTRIFRLGGDEFVAVCTGSGAVGRAVTQADVLSRALRERFVVDGSDLFVGASFGVAVADDGTGSPEALLRNADVAMYANKRDPLTVVSVYDDEMADGLSSQLEIDAALRSTLDGDGVTVHFQPLVDVESTRSIVVEALVRWNRDGRLVFPAEFLPVARSHGLMGDLGRAVIRQALDAMRTVGDDLPGFSLWLNVDLLQLRDPGFPGVLADELRSAGFPADQLVLELSESDLLDLQEIDGVIAELRAMGVRLALDDFGTGYSTIVRLTELPVDVVKLDRALVAGVAAGDDAAFGILSAAVALVTHAGLEIVVEGVETQSELDAVRQLGCTIVQGYLFRRPGPAHEVLDEERTSGGLGSDRGGATGATRSNWATSGRRRCARDRHGRVDPCPRSVGRRVASCVVAGRATETDPTMEHP